MKKQINFALLLISFSVFFSCTIQKRTVNKGFYIQWNKHYSKNAEANNEAALKAENEVEIRFENSERPAETAFESTAKTNDQAVVEDAPAKLEISTKQVVKPRFEKPQQQIHKVEKLGKLLQKKLTKKQQAAPISRELEIILNILLCLVFAALTALFISLALHASGYLVIIYWVCAVICAVVFVTQVIDVIQS